MGNEGHKRILVLRYRFFGDTILTVPFLRNLRRAEPDAKIDWVVAPGSAEAIQGIPYVDELIFWDPPTIHADSRGTHRTWRDKLRFISDLRARHYDTVYVLKRSLSSAIMAFLTGARRRVGFATDGRGILLTRLVPYRNDQHEVQNFLDVLRADGIPVVNDYLECWTSAEEEGAAARLLTENGVEEGERLVALHPFAAAPERSWPLENFAELAGLLRSSGYRPVILGGPRDTGSYAELAERFGDAVDLVGKPSLRVTMALLRRCSLFVGNDSGIMHLAAAVHLPLVALFGPQSPTKFGPWGERAVTVSKKFPCSPCRQKFFAECEPSPRGRPPCIEAISVEEVFDACQALCEGEEAK